MRIVLFAIAALAWLAAIVWFAVAPGFEPLIAVLIGLASLLEALGEGRECAATRCGGAAGDKC